MYIDVRDLRRFYSSDIGTYVRHNISDRLRTIWPDTRHQTVLGFGFTPPFLESFREEALRCGALMPAAQGVFHWPEEDTSQTALIDDDQMPLPNNSVDKLLIIHALEHSASHQILLEEAWRILVPAGQICLVVPNRQGIWARLDSTPFGFGRPFSKSQLSKALTNTGFEVTSWHQALHGPPFSIGKFPRYGNRWESLAARFWPAFAGVHMAVAVKKVYNPIMDTEKEKGLVMAPVMGQPV